VKAINQCDEEGPDYLHCLQLLVVSSPGSQVMQGLAAVQEL